MRPTRSGFWIFSWSAANAATQTNSGRSLNIMLAILVHQSGTRNAESALSPLRREGGMAHTIAHADRPFTRDRTFVAAPAHQAFRLLQVAFVLAPIIAGVDKFFHVLTNWTMYLAPTIANALPV